MPPKRIHLYMPPAEHQTTLQTAPCPTPPPAFCFHGHGYLKWKRACVRAIQAHGAGILASGFHRAAGHVRHLGVRNLNLMKPTKVEFQLALRIYHVMYVCVTPVDGSSRRIKALFSMSAERRRWIYGVLAYGKPPAWAKYSHGNEEIFYSAIPLKLSWRPPHLWLSNKGLYNFRCCTRKTSD